MINNHSLFKSAICCRSQLTHCMSVRWKMKPRKPIWLGTAKSKMFVIPKKFEHPPDEKVEMDRLNNIYDRQIKSLHTFMANYMRSETEMKGFDLEREFEKSVLLNEEWNLKSAKLREERVKKESKIMEEKILAEVIEHENIEKPKKARAEEIVRTEIALSETFVTPENLDRVIDECLATVKDYNYAIDLKGNIYKGDSKTPVDHLIYDKPVMGKEFYKSQSNHMSNESAVFESTN